VDAKTKLHMKVPFHYVKAEESQAVKFEHCVVNHVISELEVTCFPGDLPEFIEVDLSGLDTSHSLHVSGVKLPPGVSAVTHRTGDPVVATAVVPKAAAEAETEAAEGEAVAAPATEAKATEAKAEDKAKKDEKKK
jgi:large subunit ribosomal protein L25